MDLLPNQDSTRLFCPTPGRLARAIAFLLLASLLSGHAHAQGVCEYISTGSCGTVAVGSSTTCTVSISPNPNITYSCGDAYIEGAPGLSGTSSEFTLLSTTCEASSYLKSCTATVQFSPTSDGSVYDEVVIPTDYGDYDFEVDGTGGSSTGTVSVSSGTLSCGSIGVNQGAECGTITVSATGGSVTLASTPFTLSTTTGFQVSAGSCASGATIASGSSCTIGPIELLAGAAGPYSTTVTVNTQGSGSANVTVSGAVNSFVCVPNAAQNQYCALAPL